MVTKNLNPAIEQPSSAAVNDADGAIVAQEISEDELLNAQQLATLVTANAQSSPGSSRPWLRNNSLAQALNYRGPMWLIGWENWAYLLLAVLIAGGLYWHFKK